MCKKINVRGHVTQRLLEIGCNFIYPLCQFNECNNDINGDNSNSNNNDNNNYNNNNNGNTGNRNKKINNGNIHFCNS